MENKRILIAEDNENQRTLIKEILKNSLPDYSFETFENGASLKNKLNEFLIKGNRNIKAIITDNNMPRYTGSKLIAKYAKMKEFKKIPFLLVYGGDESIGKRAVKNGAFAYVQKPYKIWEFSNLVKKAISSF